MIICDCSFVGGLEEEKREMIILFVIDTSASMNQKYPNGFSLLDCAKNGVEHLIKVG